MRVGSSYEYLKRKAEAGNARAQADLAEIVQPQSEFLFDAFLVLSKSRGAGMDGPSPLSIRDIIAYSDFLGVSGASQKRRFVRAVQAMDRAYLEFDRGRTRT